MDVNSSTPDLRTVGHRDSNRKESSFHIKFYLLIMLFECTWTALKILKIHRDTELDLTYSHHAQHLPWDQPCSRALEMHACKSVRIREKACKYGDKSNVSYLLNIRHVIFILGKWTIFIFHLHCNDGASLAILRDKQIKEECEASGRKSLESLGLLLRSHTWCSKLSYLMVPRCSLSSPKAWSQSPPGTLAVAQSPTFPSLWR